MTDTNTLAPADAEILDAAEDFRSQYTPAEHAQAIEDAAIAYAEARHTQGSDLYNGTTYSARQVLKSGMEKCQVAAALSRKKSICGMKSLVG